MSQARRAKNHWPLQTATGASRTSHRWKRRKVAHPLVVRRAGEKTMVVRNGGRLQRPSVMPDAALPGHKSSYMQSRLMCRCPRCGASGARVSAVSPRASRPTARFIEYNGVLCPGRRLRCAGQEIISRNNVGGGKVAWLPIKCGSILTPRVAPLHAAPATNPRVRFQRVLPSP